MSAQRDEINAMLGRFATAWKANSGSTLGSFFVEDGSLVNPFGQRADGRAAVAAMYTEYFGGMLRGTTTTFALGTVRNIGSDLALMDAEEAVLASDGSTVLTVHLTALVRRDAAGWLFVDARPHVVAAIPA